MDFINHAIKDGTLYFTVRFQDKTMFSLHYRCDMFAVGADLCDVKTGNLKIIREYMRPNSEEVDNEPYRTAIGANSFLETGANSGATG